MIEPTPFASARPGSPFQAAVTDTAASGEVVPRLTTVAPMMIFDIPSMAASEAAPPTNHPAPRLSSRMLTTQVTSSTHVLAA